MGKPLFLGCRFAGQSRRIVEGMMDNLGLSWEHGARLGGVVTDRDHVVKWNVFQILNVLRLLVCNVDTCLGHDLHRAGIQSMGFDASRVGFELIGFQFPCPTLGHLASARIPGTKKKYS